MNKKIPLGIVIALLCLGIALSSGITMKLISAQYNSILEGLPEKLDRYEILDELDDVINEHFYGKSDGGKLEQAIAQGYVRGLTDGSSVYMTAEKYADYKTEISGEMLGIGAEYEKNSDGYIRITKVYSGSPAQSSGLKKGDVIVAFDGIRINESNYDEMEQKLRGDKLTSVNIIYISGEEEKTATVVKGYEARSVFTDVYENVGYISISDFYPSTAAQLEKALDSFLSSSIAGIVIDLRDNKSANYAEAVKCLDLFVQMSDSERPAAKVVDENKNTVLTFATTSGEINLPVKVLVSKNTAMAAELFACNIRDFGKGEIIGAGKTKGAAIVQQVFELSSGGAVLLTTGEILPYSSESYASVGITPDYIEKDTGAESNIEADGQFLFAANLITQQSGK